MLPTQHRPAQIPSIAASPTHKASASPTETAMPDPVQGPDRLSRVPACILDKTAEWLDETDAVHLMKASRLHHALMNQYFRKRLQPEWRKVPTLPRLYQHPSFRIDRFIHLDYIGRQHLTSLGLHYPLSRKIKNGEISLKQASNVLIDNRRQMQVALSGSNLTKRQQDYFFNSLIAEHVLCGHCSIPQALRQTGKQMHLFYSLSLQSLLRSGELDPVDLDGISAAGISLLHAPALVGLFRQGLIRKNDLLHLTDNQYQAILICLPWITNRKLAMSSVLALEAPQLDAMRKADLLDRLHTMQITLAAALQLIQPNSTSAPPDTDPVSSMNPTAPVSAVLPDESGIVMQSSDFRLLLSRTPIGAVRKALFTEDGIEWLRTFGKVIHHLSVDTILRHLDTSDAEYRSVFESFDGGMDSDIAEQGAIATMQIYLNLADHLSSRDFLKVVQPFLTDVFGYIVAEGCHENLDYLVPYCNRVWTAVQTACVITGTPLAQLRAQAMPLLKESLLQSHLLSSDAESECIGDFASLLTVMALQNDEELFRIWCYCSGQRNFDKSIHSLECMQALFSPFDKTDTGAVALDLIAAEIDKARSLQKP